MLTLEVPGIGLYMINFITHKILVRLHYITKPYIILSKKLCADL